MMEWEEQDGFGWGYSYVYRRDWATEKLARGGRCPSVFPPLYSTFTLFCPIIPSLGRCSVLGFESRRGDWCGQAVEDCDGSARLEGEQGC